jgi:hypothetical protein
MKISYRYFSLALIGGMMLLNSCTDDLNTEPLTDQTITSTVAWADTATYTTFLAKIYAGLALSGNAGPNGGDDMVSGDQGEATFIRSYWNLQELPTDEAVIAWSDDGLNGLQFNRWTSDNRFVQLVYNRLFLNIAFCNEYIRETTDSKLDSRGLSAAMKSHVVTYRNECRALRALNYFIAMDLYANVPFVTEANGVGSYLPQQIDRKSLFTWIETELTSCLGNLPPKSQYGSINDATVNMILAKMYLNAEVYIGEDRYTDCITAVKNVISAGYSLETNYQNNFCADNNTSSEIIYPIVYDGKHATTYGGTTYLMASAWGSDMNPGSNYGLGQSWSGNRVTQALTQLFEDGDNRALFYTDKRTEEVTAWNDYYKGWACVKYTNLNRNGSAGQDNLFADTDFPLFRLADAYLIYAEAVVRGGQGGSKSQAVTYVNDLRTRANASTITEAQLTLPFLLDERGRELYWEGQRRTDLIRFNSFTANKTWPWKNGVVEGTANIDDKYNIFPLPSTDLSANSNLTQNSGY